MERGIDVAVRLAGNSQSALARLLGKTPQCVQNWVRRGKPSPEGSRLIERIFGARCTRVMLDPETFGPLAA